MGHFLEVCAVSVVLSIDSFSAALAVGFRPIPRWKAIRFALTSGIAEAAVATLGFISGTQIFKLVSGVDHWIAFSGLMLIGLKMTWDALKKLRKSYTTDARGPALQHSVPRLIIISLITSLDALGIGLALGATGKQALQYVPAIGVTATLATILGLYLARKLSYTLGPRIEILGGLILVVLSFQMLKI